MIETKLNTFRYQWQQLTRGTKAHVLLGFCPFRVPCPLFLQSTLQYEVKTCLCRRRSSQYQFCNITVCAVCMRAAEQNHTQSSLLGEGSRRSSSELFRLLRTTEEEEEPPSVWTLPHCARPQPWIRSSVCLCVCVGACACNNSASLERGGGHLWFSPTCPAMNVTWPGAWNSACVLSKTCAMCTLVTDDELTSARSEEYWVSARSGA